MPCADPESQAALCSTARSIIFSLTLLTNMLRRMKSMRQQDQPYAIFLPVP